MATKNLNVHDETAFVFDSNLLEFRNGSVRLKALASAQDVVSYDTPAVTPLAPASDASAITDGDPETEWLDRGGGYGQVSTLEWDFGFVTRLTGFTLGLAKDFRRWGLLVVESTAEVDFSDKTKINVLFATGIENEVALYLSGYSPGIAQTHPNVGIKEVVKSFSAVSAARIRIVIRAHDQSHVPDRVVSRFSVRPAPYSLSARCDMKTPFQASALSSWLESPASTIPSGTEIRYSLVVDGARVWHDGTGWRPADGTAADSTAASGLTAPVLGSLLADRGFSNVLVSIHLIGQASVTPEFRGLEIQYSDQDPAPTFPSTRLTGIVRSPLDVPLVGVTVTATFIAAPGVSYYLWNDVRFESDQVSKTTVTDQDGHFSIMVLPTTLLEPDTGLYPDDQARWRLVLSGQGVNLTLEDEVAPVEEIDVFRDGFGI